MGALATKALRPIKSFNIENRAHRVISREKPTPAPTYSHNLEDLRRTLEANPDLDGKLDKKDDALDLRLKDVYVTSTGRPEDDITRDKRESTTRPLPQDRALVKDFDFGFKEPDKIKYGHTTLRNVINFISAHQINPEEVTAQKIALEYKLREEDVSNIVKYFKTYEVYIPETKTSPAVFAGPAMMRKQLYKIDIKEIEDKGTKGVESKSDGKLSAPRDKSVGAASLGARRDAPVPKQAPSVRSDERPLATQGDMLNSIKFQRRYRETLQNEKLSEFSFSKPSKEKNINNLNNTNTIARAETRKTAGTASYPYYLRDKQSLYTGQRPPSAKGRQRTDSFLDRIN